MDRLVSETDVPNKGQDTKYNDPYRTPLLPPYAGLRAGTNGTVNTAAAITAQGLCPASRSTPSNRPPRASLAPESSTDIERGGVGLHDESIPLTGLSPELDAVGTTIPPTPVTETITKASARADEEGVRLVQDPPPSTGPVSNFLASFPSTAISRRQRRRVSFAKNITGARITFPTPLKETPKTPLPTPRSQEVFGLKSPSLRVRFPSPVIMTVVCEESDHVAVLLGSVSGQEPTEVLVFALLCDETFSQPSLQPRVSRVVYRWKLVASVPVKRSRYAAEPVPLPLTSGSIALVTKFNSSNGNNPDREVVLILSAVYELPDANLTDRPAIHIVVCPSNRPPLAVEHDVPLFAVAPIPGSGRLWAAGDGEAGAILLEFDPNWRSYTWARRLPAAALPGDEAIDDICSLILIEWHGRRCLMATSASGLVALWSLETLACVSVGADAQHAISSIIAVIKMNVPLSVSGTGINTCPRKTDRFRFLAVALNREMEPANNNGLVPPLYLSSTPHPNPNRLRVLAASMTGELGLKGVWQPSSESGGGLDWEEEPVTIPADLQLQHGPVTAVGHFWVIENHASGRHSLQDSVLVFGFSDGRVRCVRPGVHAEGGPPKWTAAMDVSIGSPITSIQVRQVSTEAAASRNIFIVFSSLSGEIIVLGYPKMEAFLSSEQV